MAIVAQSTLKDIRDEMFEKMLEYLSTLSEKDLQNADDADKLLDNNITYRYFPNYQSHNRFHFIRWRKLEKNFQKNF